ncbi:MAG: hypothetical protein M1371_10350 [Actinobacteria bacterium]|nr:hypothetical protein [Actinomycetota bacterium]
MTGVVEYLRQFPELCTKEVIKLLEDFTDRDPNNILEALDAAYENEDMPPG